MVVSVQREEQADAVGAAEVEMLADDRLEEVAALDRLIEHVREAHFALTDGEPMVVAGRDGLTGEVDGDLRARARPRLGLERAYLLLRHADDDDALPTREAPSRTDSYERNETSTSRNQCREPNETRVWPPPEHSSDSNRRAP